MKTEILAKADQVVTRILETGDYEIHGDETYAEIVEIARQNWNEDSAWREQNRRPQIMPSDANLAVTFLRHERSNYDRILSDVQYSLFGLETELFQWELDNNPEFSSDDETHIEAFDDIKNMAHKEVRQRILTAIASKFPELSIEASKQSQSNFIMSGGQTHHVGR